MIPGVDLVTFVQTVSILGVALVIFAESGLLIGFFLPGDSLLFTAGFLIFTGVLNVNIFIAILVLFIAAALGDSVGYTFGRKAGPRIFSKPDARLFKKEYIIRAHEFYEKHGAKTIVLARFIPIVRTFAPILAGAFLWTAGVAGAGYFLGKWFHMAGIDIDKVILPIVAAIIVISVLPPAIHIFKDKKNRDAFVRGAKKQFASIFSSKK